MRNSISKSKSWLIRNVLYPEARVANDAVLVAVNLGDCKQEPEEYHDHVCGYYDDDLWIEVTYGFNIVSFVNSYTISILLAGEGGERKEVFNAHVLQFITVNRYNPGPWCSSLRRLAKSARVAVKAAESAKTEIVG